MYLDDCSAAHSTSIQEEEIGGEYIPGMRTTALLTVSTQASQCIATRNITVICITETFYVKFPQCVASPVTVKKKVDRDIDTYKAKASSKPQT